MKCSRIGWTLTIAVAIILFLPYIFGNYLLINNSPDMVAHTAIINAIVNGTELPPILYRGQLIAGYPLAWIVSVTHIPTNTVYLLFNYLVLMLVPIVLYVVVRNLMGQWYALLVAPVSLLCSTSVLVLFQYGIIYSIINMYIILPLTILASIKWVTKRKIAWLVAALLLITLFSVFHPTGLYLKYVLIIGGGLYLLWKLVKSHRYILAGVCMFVMVLVLNWLLYNNIGVITGVVIIPDRNIIISPMQFIQQILGIPVFLLITLLFIRVVVFKHRITLNPEGKIFILVLSSFVISFIGGLFIYRTTEDVVLRLSIDASIIIAIITGALLGRMLQYMSAGIKVVHYLAIAGLTIPTLVVWLR